MPRVQGEGLLVRPNAWWFRRVMRKPVIFTCREASGHFLSPFYRSGHEAWVRVEPSPLLPGRRRTGLR